MSQSKLYLAPGDELIPITKHLNQEKINYYAEASGDYNPIHVDNNFAAQTPLGGTIAHGMLILAYVSEMMTVNFEENWLNGGKLDIRFKSPARPGDVLNIKGKLTDVDQKHGILSVKCEVVCQNQKGEIVLLGETLTSINIDYVPRHPILQQRG